MKFIYTIPAIIYRTYDDRGLDIPHFRAIVTIIFLLFMYAVCVGLLFNIPSHYIIPWSSQESKNSQWLKALIYFLIPITLLSIVFNKKKLDDVVVTENQIYNGRKILPVYLVASIILLMLLLLRHGVRKGTIHI